MYAYMLSNCMEGLVMIVNAVWDLKCCCLGDDVCNFAEISEIVFSFKKSLNLLVSC